MTFENTILVVGGTLMGLLAGLFSVFSFAIVPALRSLNAKQHLAAMQAINVKIVNAVFLIIFLGPSVLLPLAAFLHRAPLLWLAAALHIIGVNGVTIAGNVPLNDRLAEIDVHQLSEADAERIRQDFQGKGARWMRLHHIRTLAATAATVLAFIACLSSE